MSGQLAAAHGYVWRTHDSPDTVESHQPRFAPVAPGMAKGFLQFLKLQARGAHSNESDKGSEHFVCAFADLIDAGIAQHAFEGFVSKIRCATVNLEGVVNEHPYDLGAEHFEHRGLQHVILESPINKRGGDGGHGFERIRAGSHAGNFFLDQLEVAERAAKLLARVRMVDGQPQAGVRRAGATGTESCAPKIEHGQGDL